MPEDISDPVRLLQKLALNEIIQFVVPLAYMLSLIVAYNGKNASLMGGIGSDMWQYEKIEDINETLTRMLWFFLTDLTSMVVCSTLLWVTCEINFFKVVCFILNEFGLVLSILIGFSVSMVSSVKLYRINCVITVKTFYSYFNIFVTISNQFSYSHSLAQS